jgi:hypothetical protein
LALLQPALSPVQKQAFLKWSSIKEVNPGLKVYDPDALDPTDIVQDVVKDCSLIAAFSVLINHAKRFQSKVPKCFSNISSSILYQIYNWHPSHDFSSMPHVSEEARRIPGGVGRWNLQSQTIP